MIQYENLKKKPEILKGMTGLTLAAFEELLSVFETAYEKEREEQDKKRTLPRQRRRGAGQKGALPKIEDKVVFILFYFRMYPVQMAQGYFFGMGQSQANEWIHRLTPVLQRVLGYQLVLPARTPQTLSQVLSACPGLEFIIDGTERPIRRPKKKERQQERYSGKKKHHTLKNNVLTDKRTRTIVALSPTVAGKCHDKKVADDSLWTYPEGSKL
jgi:hypothetical protein